MLLRKFAGCKIKNKKVNLKVLVASGGMPSSHSAIVTSLMTSIGIEEGFNSTIFAVAFVFSLIVMYDAAGVRRATGEHATIINKMMKLHNDGESVFGDKYLKELVGHSPFQVTMGAILGGLIGILYVI